MKTLFVDKAPKAVGPYCHCTVENDVAYVSGQLPVNPQSSKIESDDVAEQAMQSLANLKSILEELGVEVNHVLKTTVLLNDMGNFQKVNAVYEDFFKGHKPARSCFAVKELPMGALVEIEAIVSLTPQ